MDYDSIKDKPFTLWHEEPPIDVFVDMQENAIKIWETYDDTYGYASEKIARVAALTTNKRDYMLMWNMFDTTNQAKFRQALSKETREYLARVLNGE